MPRPANCCARCSRRRSPPPLRRGRSRPICRRRCRATIGEINTVRKHLSAIKGGRLAAAAAPARVVTLAISDVPGDDPAVIASGPTVPDPTSFADARAVLAKYGIDEPKAVIAHLAEAH